MNALIKLLTLLFEATEAFNVTFNAGMEAMNRACERSLVLRIALVIIIGIPIGIIMGLCFLWLTCPMPETYVFNY